MSPPKTSRKPNWESGRLQSISRPSLSNRSRNRCRSHVPDRSCGHVIVRYGGSHVMASSGEGHVTIISSHNYLRINTFCLLFSQIYLGVCKTPLPTVQASLILFYIREIFNFSYKYLYKHNVFAFSLTFHDNSLVLLNKTFNCIS